MSSAFIPKSILHAADLNAAFAHHFDLLTPNTVSGSVSFLGNVTFSSIAITGALVVGTTVESASRPGFQMFDNYHGDNARPWFTGGNWGFGWNPLTLADARIRPLSIQRDSAYAGTLVGANPGALQITNNVTSSVTGLESALISTINTSASDGLGVSGTFNVVKSAIGSSVIVMNIVAGDNTGRKSSVSGAHVACETDINASGPDDAFNRVNMDVTFKETPSHPSADGATSFMFGGIRCRGGALNLAQGGGLTVPCTSTIAFGAMTLDPTNGGLVGQFTTPFLSDGCSGAAYSAVSAVQILPTSAAALIGATTITLTNPLSTASHVWVGALVTGAGIAAATHVATSTYNSTTQITTITIDKPTSSALTSGQNLTFTNAIGTGFHAAGFLTTAAFSSPGFSVSPTGAITAQGATYSPLPTNAANDAAAASAGVIVGGTYRNGSVLQVRVV